MPRSAAPPSSRRRPQTVAVVLCAGQGTRMGAKINKVFLPVLGRPLLVYAIEAFARSSAIDEILLVAHPLEVDYCATEIVQKFQLPKVGGIIPGGQSRHQSEDRALTTLRPRIEAGRVSIVLVHDGARPVIMPDDLDRLVAATRASGGALLATPVPDDESIARLSPEGLVNEILPTANLWRAETPQSFDAQLLLAAYDQARAEQFEGTDTAMAFERAGHQVQVVPGQGPNLKVTTPEDLLRAEWYLRPHR